MINVKKTIYNNLNKGMDRLRLFADNNTKLFKKVLSLIVLDDVYEWSEYLDDKQSIQKKLRDLRTNFILCNQDLEVCKMPVGHEYINVNTPQSDDTWKRVWDSEDVVILEGDQQPVIIEYLNLTDLDRVDNVSGGSYVYVNKDGYIFINEDTVNQEGYITE